MGADREYRVVLRAKSRVTLGRGEAIKFVEQKAGIHASVRTLYRTDERGTAFPGDLEVTAIVSAADVNAASAMAFEQAHFLAAVFGLVGVAPVHLPRFHLVHEIGPDESERFVNSSKTISAYDPPGVFRRAHPRRSSRSYLNCRRTAISGCRGR